MFRPSRLRCTVLLLLALVLLWPWPMAAEAAGEASTAWSLPLDPWAFAARLWAFLVSSATEEGCSVDPNGRCAGGVEGGETESLDNGCSVDPDGRCAGGGAEGQSPTGDNGCSVDPNGGYGR